MQKTVDIRKMILAALFLASAYVLPYLSGQIPEVGSTLCPMHFPVMLCGFICGPTWGVAVGLTAPILRSLLTGGFPPMFPTACAMAIELAVYGLACGVFREIFPKRRIFIYPALLISMILGRIAWGLAMYVMLGGSFTLEEFVAGAFTNAVLGIILQLLLVPWAVLLIERGRAQ